MTNIRTNVLFKKTALTLTLTRIPPRLRSSECYIFRYGKQTETLNKKKPDASVILVHLIFNSIVKTIKLFNQLMFKQQINREACQSK